MTFQIVFQHPDFIVINKPNGISVHKDDADVGLTRLVAQQLGVPQVWLVHRLDKVTSGLLILALNEKAAMTLSRKFAEHQIQKTYLALATQAGQNQRRYAKSPSWCVETLSKQRKSCHYRFCVAQLGTEFAFIHSVSQNR